MPKISALLKDPEYIYIFENKTFALTRSSSVLSLFFERKRLGIRGENTDTKMKILLVRQGDCYFGEFR